MVENLPSIICPFSLPTLSSPSSVHVLTLLQTRWLMCYSWNSPKGNPISGSPHLTLPSSCDVLFLDSHTTVLSPFRSPYGFSIFPLPCFIFLHYIYHHLTYLLSTSLYFLQGYFFFKSLLKLEMQFLNFWLVLLLFYFFLNVPQLFFSLAAQALSCFVQCLHCQVWVLPCGMQDL